MPPSSSSPESSIASHPTSTRPPPRRRPHPTPGHHERSCRSRGHPTLFGHAPEAIPMTNTGRATAFTFLANGEMPKVFCTTLALALTSGTRSTRAAGDRLGLARLLLGKHSRCETTRFTFTRAFVTLTLTVQQRKSPITNGCKSSRTSSLHTTAGSKRE